MNGVGASSGKLSQYYKTDMQKPQNPKTPKPREANGLFIEEVLILLERERLEELLAIDDQRQ